MPYKDKEKQKEAVRRAVERKRKGITEGITNEGITKKGITDDEGITSDVNPDSEYIAIVYVLADIKRRAKLRAICNSLENVQSKDKPDLRKHVYMGYPGAGGIACDVISELLEAFSDG
jgi:hypothetical protein